MYIRGFYSYMYNSCVSTVVPRKIEEKILPYGPIMEVVVLGVPDPKWGEIGVMVGVLKDGAQWGPEEFQSWLDQNVARYKHPRKVFIWPELPKSGYGKITKKIIYKELLERGLLPNT